MNHKSDLKKTTRLKAASMRKACAQMGGIAASEAAAGHGFNFLKTEPLTRIIALYHPLKDELDPRYLATHLEKAGYHLALPRIVTLLAPNGHAGDKQDFQPSDAFFNPHPSQASLTPSKQAPCPLEFRRYSLGDPLVPGPFGTQEPSIEAPLVTPHIILCPLLAYDSRGHRLGYGGGYYDRVLARLDQVKAYGYAYAGQWIEKLPHEAHDHPLRAVITESGVYIPTGKA